MNEYVNLLSRLTKQKRKIKDLPELIWKVSFHGHRIRLLKAIVEYLEDNEDLQDFRWVDSPKDKKRARTKGKKILGQFSFKVGSPYRTLTIYKKP